MSGNIRTTLHSWTGLTVIGGYTASAVRSVQTNTFIGAGLRNDPSTIRIQTAPSLARLVYMPPTALRQYITPSQAETGTPARN